MKILIIYDSVFGNTEQIARVMGDYLAGKTVVKKVNEVMPEDLKDLNLLLVGSPTRGFKPTEGIMTFLKGLPAGSLKGLSAAAFDTRIPLDSINNAILRNLVKMGGYADKIIAKQLKQKGATLLPSAGFLVSASEGPLVVGEVKRAVDWIKELVSLVSITP